MWCVSTTFARGGAWSYRPEEKAGILSGLKCDVLAPVLKRNFDHSKKKKSRFKKRSQISLNFTQMPKCEIYYNGSFIAADPIFSFQASSIMKYLVNSHPHSLTRICLFALRLSVCVWPRRWMRWVLEPPSTLCLRRHTDSLTLLWT